MFDYIESLKEGKREGENEGISMPELSWLQACWFSWDEKRFCSTCAPLPRAEEPGGRLFVGDLRLPSNGSDEDKRTKKSERKQEREWLGRSYAGLDWLKWSCLGYQSKSVSAYSSFRYFLRSNQSIERAPTEITIQHSYGKIEDKL